MPTTGKVFKGFDDLTTSKKLLVKFTNDNIANITLQALFLEVLESSFWRDMIMRS
jgi:hypothetical protein